MKTPPQPSTSTSSTFSSLSGYRIVNMNLLAGLFRQRLCPQCKTQSIDLQVKPARGSGTGTAGIHSVLLAQCEKCNETITSAPTSEITVPDSVSVANIRTVASLVAPLPSSEQTNLLSSNHTYTKSMPKHIHHHYAPSVTSTHTTHIISSTAPTYAPHCRPWICGQTPPE